jgi:hypothetical protein
MPMFVRLLTLGALVSASLLAAAPAPAADTIDAAAAPLAPVRANESFTMNALLGYVNSQPMFVGDLLRPIDEDLRRMARQSRNISDFKQGARAAIESQMRRQISEVLIYSAAKAVLSDEDKQRIDIFLNKQKFELLSKYGGSQALADQALRAVGSSVEKALQDQRRKLTVDLYLHKQLWPRVVVTRQMVLEDYEKDPKKWSQDAELELFTITIPFSQFLRVPTTDGTKGPLIQNPSAEQIAGAETSSMGLARALIARNKKGEDWARLAEDYSADSHAKVEGGRWPKVHRGSLARDEVEKLAFSLPANTVGEPLLLRDDKDPAKSAVMIIKVGQKKDAQVVSFTDAQDDIKGRLREQQYRQLTDAYMAKLYKDAAVEAVDKMVDVAVDAAISRYATGADGK